MTISDIIRKIAYEVVKSLIRYMYRVEAFLDVNMYFTMIFSRIKIILSQTCWSYFGLVPQGNDVPCGGIIWQIPQLGKNKIMTST